MASNELHADLSGWWRIRETSQWVNDGLDDLGPAMISITGYADRLRMHCLLADVNVRPTKIGASFTWGGAWEYDQMSGTGSVKLGKDGRLRGRIKIKDGDERPPRTTTIVVCGPYANSRPRVWRADQATAHRFPVCCLSRQPVPSETHGSNW